MGTPRCCPPRCCRIFRISSLFLLRQDCRRSCPLRSPRWYRGSHWSWTRCRRDWIRTCHSLLQRRRCPGSLLGGEGTEECHMTRTSVTNKRTLCLKVKKKKKKKKKKKSTLVDTTA